MTRQTIPNETQKHLALHVGEFTEFSAALIKLAELLPERVTVAQATFFLLAARADLSGKPATFTDIKNTAGAAINRSMHTTYKVFVQGGRMRDRVANEGLNWLRRTENPADNREKFLHLTASGREVMNELLVALTPHGQI